MGGGGGGVGGERTISRYNLSIQTSLRPFHISLAVYDEAFVLFENRTFNAVNLQNMLLGNSECVCVSEDIMYEQHQCVCVLG